MLADLDNLSKNKINSYLHKYLSESDDLWINPTPLDERDPIKISAALNKPTHMEFGPSCQFNNVELSPGEGGEEERGRGGGRRGDGRRDRKMPIPQLAYKPMDTSDG